MAESYLESLLAFASTSIAALRFSQQLIDRHRTARGALDLSTIDQLESAVRKATAALQVVVVNLPIVLALEGEKASRQSDRLNDPLSSGIRKS